MKKRIGAACALMLALLLSGGCAAENAPRERTIVTTFYPMYVFTRNVAQGAAGVRVVSMAQEDVGCLHDYQLKTQDMVLLEEADVLVINGGGMEPFMDRVAAMRPELPVVVACEGIDLLAGDRGHDHDHGHDHGGGEEGELLNAHVWLDPALAVLQVENIARGLSQADPQHAAQYEQNAQAYAARLLALDGELRAKLAPIAGEEIVTFHEAFDYFARAYDLRVAGVIEQEPGEEPGTRDLAELCDLVTARGVRALFVEPQYPQRAAETVARETGAAVYTLDTAVSGDGEYDSYERIMRRNAATLLEALRR